uniref:Putative peptidase n=1 Tax=viral metagenome TaxID=1070528 RepID=A0A6H1ZAR4_9ZZZZ
MLKFDFPLDKKYQFISSPFGWRWIFGKWGFHGGVDYPCPNGAPIYAPYNGIIADVGKRLRAGNILVVNHPSVGDVQTVYYHLKKVLFRVGQEIQRGEVIAETDNTGTWVLGNGHLHYGVRVNGHWIDPCLTY